MQQYQQDNKAPSKIKTIGIRAEQSEHVYRFCFLLSCQHEPLALITEPQVFQVFIKLLTFSNLLPLCPSSIQSLATYPLGVSSMSHVLEDMRFQKGFDRYRSEFQHQSTSTYIYKSLVQWNANHPNVSTKYIFIFIYTYIQNHQLHTCIGNYSLYTLCR